MVWRLDRPGRALKDLIARAEALRIQGVGLKSLKEAIDTDSVCSGAAFVRTQQVFGYLSIQPATYVACTAAYYVDAYLEAAGIAEDRRGPLFRSCKPGRRDALQDRAMSRLSALKMIKRRARKAGLPAEICANPTSPTQRELCRFSLFSTTQVIELLESCTPNSPQYCL